jgi:phenylalanyl-tRNA synthetase beta chain
MGGETTEMSGSTTRVLVEAAHFDPVSIARTARRHRLPSEASRRFERGVDPAIPAAAAVRVGALLTEFGGGRVVDVTLTGRFTPPPAASLGAGLSTRVLGMEVAPSTVLRCLATVGCEVESLDDTFAVTPRPGARTSSTPTTSSRRSPGWSAMTRSRPCCPWRRLDAD